MMEEKQGGVKWRLDALDQLGQALSREGIKVTGSIGVLNFILDQIDEREDWKAVGQAFFVPYVASGENEEVLQLQLMVAHHIEPEAQEPLKLQLYRLNQLAMFGTLGVNGEGQLYYLTRIPMVGRPPEKFTQTAEFVLYEMVRFLDLFYGYLMLLITEPGKLTLERYLELKVGQVTLPPEGTAL